MLTPPAEVMSNVDVQRRLMPYLGAPRYPDDGPRRADLVEALANTRSEARA